MSSESLLEEALAASFSPPPLKRQSLVQVTETTTPAAEEGTTSIDTPSNPSPGEAEVEAWKSEYEEHVKEWRAQNAEAREKAEQERARWEAVREKEKTEEQTHPSREASDWHTVSEQPSLAASANFPISGSPSPVDVRDLVSGEPQRHAGPSTTHSERHDAWEDLPSEMTSSYPSMSFPSDEHSSSPEHPKPPSNETSRPPLTATAAVFDSSLTTGTRVKALCASVAINLVLPFVNGVMLGFGEIFAKNVVLRWLGWNAHGPTGPVASSLGLGSNRRQR